MGHAVLFFSLAYFVLSVCALIVLSMAHPSGEDLIRQHPSVELLVQTVMYVVTLAIAYWLFPTLWKRTFGEGIQWNNLAARRYWFWVLPGGIALSLLTQFGERFITAPKDIAIEHLMQTTAGAWGVTAFGFLIAPVAEEIAFRGFLLPALAIAYDWLRLERTPAGLRRWQETSDLSLPALVFGSVFSSVAFSLLHAGQLQHAWGMVGMLFGVSLVFSYVRLRTHSVACSTMMHMVYNLTIFIQMLIATGGFRHLDQLK